VALAGDLVWIGGWCLIDYENLTVCQHHALRAVTVVRIFLELQGIQEGDLGSSKTRAKAVVS
jgi:hypothetical protein